MIGNAAAPRQRRPNIHATRPAIVTATEAPRSSTLSARAPSASRPRPARTIAAPAGWPGPAARRSRARSVHATTALKSGTNIPCPAYVSVRQRWSISVTAGA